MQTRKTIESRMPRATLARRVLGGACLAALLRRVSGGADRLAAAAARVAAAPPGPGGALGGARAALAVPLAGGGACVTSITSPSTGVCICLTPSAMSGGYSSAWRLWDTPFSSLPRRRRCVAAQASVRRVLARLCGEAPQDLGSLVGHAVDQEGHDLA
eukprot:scaffold145144_cov105-Phaeocystis_antarctica.AAC.1